MRKVRVVVIRIFFHLFVSTTFGHNLHRIEPKNCGCDLSVHGLVDSFKANGSFKLKFTQPHACYNIRQRKLAPHNVNVMTSLGEQYASMARALRNMSQCCRHLLVCLERRMLTSKNCATNFLMESCLVIPEK